MEIKFEVPCNDFDPLSINNGFIKIPNKPGVYIWGYWIWIDGKKTFCPMNVGEAGKGSGNLRTILIQHYCTHFETKDDGTSAFFEVNKYMSQKNIDDLYKQIGVYGDELDPNNPKRINQIKELKSEKLTRLIFYQDKIFFDFKIPSKEKNIGLISLIEFLQKNKVDGALLNKIIERQEIHLKNFFCIYAILEKDEATSEKDETKRRRKIENTINKALKEKLGIATIADKKKDVDKDLKINLSEIKKELVKLSEYKDYIKQTW